ncbi:transcriptional regulator [bacterium]|nr:transcriptional regulator [bacterium]
MKIGEIVKVLSGIRDEASMGRFLEEILTPAEIHDLSLRWELMKRLKKNMPQRRIAQELGISLCKITRGAKIIHDPRSVTNRILSKP